LIYIASNASGIASVQGKLLSYGIVLQCICYLLSCSFFTGNLPLSFKPIFDKVDISLKSAAAMSVLGSVWTASEFNFSGLLNDTLKNVYVRKHGICWKH
jgi:hypothetical protein